MELKGFTASNKVKNHCARDSTQDTTRSDYGAYNPGYSGAILI